MEYIKYDDWGPFTVDGYSKIDDEVLLVFNLFFETEDNFKKCIQYIIGKLSYGLTHFPAGANVVLKIDLRGQKLDSGFEKLFKQALSIHLEELNIIRKINIDFLK